MATPIIMVNSAAALIKLLQLVSPSLPTGSFSYSQGLEWAVEADWINSEQSLGHWLIDCLQRSLVSVDLPLLREMYICTSQNDVHQLASHIDLLRACREGRELQDEEAQRGRAMAVLLRDLGVLQDRSWFNEISRCQLAGFAFSAQRWNIDLSTAAAGYLWAWLENQVINGVKIIPLGQTAGQKLLLELGEALPATVDAGLGWPIEEIGSSSPGLALASCLHECQYTRLYRS